MWGFHFVFLQLVRCDVLCYPDSVVDCTVDLQQQFDALVILQLHKYEKIQGQWIKKTALSASCNVNSCFTQVCVWWCSVCFLFCSEGGYFNAIMSFPLNYPNSPPSVRFTSDMWHPNGEQFSARQILNYGHIPFWMWAVLISWSVWIQNWQHVAS